MALDVIPTPISPEVVNKYLDKLDKRGEPYQFLTNIRSPHKIDLELNRDGAADALTITLNSDGTWVASHVLIVGEEI